MSLRNVISKKSFIAFLLFVGIVMTSSTFAYWATYVEGTTQTQTTTIQIGSPLFDEPNFVLTSDINSYKYKIDAEHLIEDPDEHVEDIIFAIIWNDEELQNQVEQGELYINYALYIEKNGKEAKKNVYKKIEKIMEFNDDFTDAVTIEYGSTHNTFTLTTSLSDKYKDKNSSLFEKYDVYIEISFTVSPIN